MVPIAASSTANDAKRLLFTSLAPVLYDYVGDPSLMQSLNHVLACSFSRIKPIELERDAEIDGHPCSDSLEGARTDTVLKCKSMSPIPPFKNELGQYSCLPTILKTLQDYQNVVSFFVHYAKEDDCLEARISFSDRLKFNFSQFASDSRIMSLKLFQLAQKQRNDLLKFPFFKIQLSLSYFMDRALFFNELRYVQENNRNEWCGGNCGRNCLSTDNSVLYQIYLHQTSEEELMYNWVKQHMNNVRENLADRIEEYFTDMEENYQMIPSRYRALQNLYEDVFDFDKSPLEEEDSTRTPEFAVWIDYGQWTKYQERYPLLKTVLLADYEWLNNDEYEDDSDDDDSVYEEPYDDMNNDDHDDEESEEDEQSEEESDESEQED